MATGSTAQAQAPAVEEQDVAARVAALEEAVAALTARVAAAERRGVSDRATIVVFSGDMDKLMAAFIIASGAATMGLDVTMYFTFFGLTALQRTTTYGGKTVPEMMVAAMLPSGPATAPSSRLNMLGMGPLFFKHIMRTNNVATLEDLIRTARELGVKLVACQMSMGVMGIKEAELLDDIAYGGVATYMEDASDSKVTLFI